MNVRSSIFERSNNWGYLNDPDDLLEGNRGGSNKDEMLEGLYDNLTTYNSIGNLLLSGHIHAGDLGKEFSMLARSPVEKTKKVRVGTPALDKNGRLENINRSFSYLVINRTDSRVVGYTIYRFTMDQEAQFSIVKEQKYDFQ